MLKTSNTERLDYLDGKDVGKVGGQLPFLVYFEFKGYKIKRVKETQERKMKGGKRKKSHVDKWFINKCRLAY